MQPDLRHLEEVTLAAFDLETTGLFPFSARIVEMAAVRARSANVAAEHFCRLVDPGEPIPEEARRIHGISDAMVRGQAVVEEVLPLFLDFLGPPDTLLLAHNASFDLGFLNVALAGMRCACPPHRVVDTAELSRVLYPSLPSHRLEAVAVALKAARSQDHRALSDARIVLDVFRALLARDAGIRTVADLARRTKFLRFTDGSVRPIGPPPGLEELSLAVKQGCAGTMVYAGGTKGLQPRRVTPHALVIWRGTAYLKAYCHTDAMMKTYRLDQVRRFSMERQG